MSNLWKRSLSMLLAVVMVLGMVPMSAFATEEQDASAPTEEVVIDEAVANVQGMINALPESVDSEVAVEAVWMAIDAIDAAAAELTEEQKEQLDYSRYNAAMDAAAAVNNPEFDEDTTWAAADGSWYWGTEATGDATTLYVKKDTAIDLYAALTDPNGGTKLSPKARTTGLFGKYSAEVRYAGESASTTTDNGWEIYATKVTSEELVPLSAGSYKAAATTSASYNLAGLSKWNSVKNFTVKTFSDIEFELGEDSDTSIEFNGFFTGANAEGFDIDELKQEIFNKLKVYSDPAGATWENVEIGYYPWYRTGNEYVQTSTGLIGIGSFSKEFHALNDTPTNRTGFTGYAFGARAYKNGATIGTADYQETVIIRYEGLEIEVDITLNESRTAATIEANQPAADATYDTLADLGKDVVIVKDGLGNEIADSNATITVTPNGEGLYDVKAKVENGGATWLPCDEVELGTYGFTYNQYAATFVDTDGTELFKVTLDNESTPVYAGETTIEQLSTIHDTDEWNYTFTGWDNDTTAEGVSGIVALNGADVTYTATYSEAKQEYTITWVNGDGTTTTQVAYGEIPEAPAASKTSTAQYHFVGGTWGEIAAVTGPATYTATFTNELRSYTITWVNGDDVTTTTTVAYGEIPEAPAAVKADKLDEDGIVMATYTGAWPTLETVTGEATYTATFTEVPKQYTVTWDIYGDEDITDDYDYGTAISEIVVPEKPADYTVDGTNWEFNQWIYPEGVDTIKGDVIITADYKIGGNDAKIIHADGTETYYMDIKAALSEVVAGETIVMLADYVQAGELGINKDNITIDGGGHSIIADENYGWLDTSKLMKPSKYCLAAIRGNNVTVKNIVFDCNKLAKGVDVIGAQNVTVENVTISNPKATALNIASSTVTVKGTLNANSVILGDSASVAENCGIVAAEGAIFTGNVTFQQSSYEYTDMDKALAADGTSYYSIKKLDANGELAGYVKSLSRLSDGYGYQLMEDVTVSSNVTLLNAGHTGTLDLNGHTLTVADGKALTVNGVLTVEGTGTLKGDIIFGDTESKLIGSENLTIEPVDAADQLGFEVVYEDGVYSLKAKITWVNGDGTTYAYYAYGEMPVAPEASKTSTAQYHYHNGTWGEIAEVTGAATYTATFTEELRSYTVTWVVDGVTSTETYEYGKMPVAPTNTDKATANYVQYTFAGWDPVVATVSGDVTYTAKYNAELLAHDGEIEVNKYYTAISNKAALATLRTDILAAAGVSGDNIVVTTKLGLEDWNIVADAVIVDGDATLQNVAGWIDAIADEDLLLVWKLAGESVEFTITSDGVSKTVTMTVTDSRDDLPKTELVVSERVDVAHITDANVLADMKAEIGELTLNSLNKTAGELPANAGDETSITYAATFPGNETFKGATVTITYEKVYKPYNDCTVIEGGENAGLGSVKVDGKAADDAAVSVVGHATVTVEVTPNSGYAVETISIYKNGALVTTLQSSDITYSNRKATVTFTSDGATAADAYVVTATYSENYLNLKADQTIVYCLENDTDVDLKELVFNTVFGGSNAPMTKDNTSVQFKTSAITIGGLGWADVDKAQSFWGTHNFGEQGSETIKLTYSDAKYGSFEQEIVLKVFDSCYNSEVTVQTITNGADASIKTQFSEEPREFEGVKYFKKDTPLTITLTPDGEILDVLGQLYNGTYGPSMAYIKDVRVYEHGSETPIAGIEVVRGQGKLDLGSILQGVNPMLYNASVTFTPEADKDYFVVVEYDILKLEKAATATVTMHMYQGGKTYAAEVPSSEEIVDAILGAEYADNFIATYGGAFTVEYGVLDGLTYKYQPVTDAILLAMADGTTVNIRVTWKPVDDQKIYYPVAVTGNVKLVDPRTATEVAGEVPEKQVNFLNEDLLIAELKADMGLGITANGAALDVPYAVTYTITGDEETGLFANVTVAYDGSELHKPVSKTFNNVPIANRPDDATIGVTIENASAVVANNDNTEQTAVDGIYTVVGNGTFNFQFTPDAGFAIESVTVNGEAVEVEYEKQIASFSLYLEEKLHYDVVVETVSSDWDLDDSRTYNFATGLDTPDNSDIVDAAITYPAAEDIDYEKVNVEYLARAEGNVTVTLPDINLGLVNIPLGTFDVDLGELWLNPEEPVEAIEEADLMQLLADLVEDLLPKIGTEVSISNVVPYIENYIKSLPLGIHAFGANGDGSTETIRISYEDAKYLIAETVTDVTIRDYRTATELVANDCEVTFGYSLADLIAASGAQVMADGAAVEGLKINTNNLGLHANTEVQQVTLSFAGDETYQPSKTTINVIVNKAACDIDYDSQNITYGDEYDFTLKNNPTVMPDGTVPEIDRIEFMIGLDMHKLLDVDFNDKEVGIDQAISYIQLRLPESIRNMPIIGELLQGEHSLSDFIDMVTGFIGIDEESLGVLSDVIEAITGITDNMDIKVIIKDEDFAPKNIGVYIAGAVTVDSDFETAYTADYLIIKPRTYDCTLAWDYVDENGILTLPAYNEVFAEMMGAHVVENENITGDVLTAANDNVKYLLLGINDDTSEFLTTDIYGDIKANIWAVDDMSELTLDNGAYVQVAYMLNWGNEIYYATPIVRSFVVTPEIIDVTLVGDNGTPNRELLKTYTGKELGFSVKVTNAAGELIYSDHYQSVVNNLGDKAEVTYNYVGVQTNGKTYQSTEKPVNAGVYAVIVKVVDKDTDENILAVGADAGLLIIEPSKSTIVVDDVTYVYDGNEHALSDLITVDSINSDKTPDTTVITAAVADTGDFSEQGWEAIEGYVNMDFPKWVDKLMAEYVPSVADGITVSELKEALAGKLPDISAQLAELGATEEIINSLANLTENVTKALDNLPGDIKLTFQDNAKAKDIGVYVVMGVVTDSDHYPAADYGILVITPDAKLVELKYDQDPNGNNILTPEALKVVDLGAKAYDPITGEEIEEATARVTNVFVGLDIYGNTVITDDPTTLDNGIYTQFSYILDVSAKLYYAEPISRVIVLVANPADVIFVDETGVEINSQTFTFDNTPKAMDVQVTVNDNVIVPAEGELVITYTGVQTNGKTYNDTVAPVHAGVYLVTANYNAYDENGKLLRYGAAVGSMIIEPAESAIEVTGGTVVYDGKGHTASVEITEGYPYADYILISGGVRVTGNKDEVTAENFHGNVNIDFPRWMDEALAEYEFFQNGIDAAYLARFITAYRNELLAIPMDQLAGLEFISQENLDAIAEKLNGYMDELVDLLGKMPADVALTFQDNIMYTAPGNYYYYGIVADSDHYASADTGLLVIEKAPVAITIESAEITYGEKTPDVVLTYSNELAKEEGVTPIITWAAPEYADAGTYTSAIQIMFHDNWNITYVGGKLTVNPAEIASVEVTGEYIYNTAEQTAEVVVKDGYGNTLVEGKDYTISGNKGTVVDTYTVTVEGIGNYTGTLTADWTIAKANVTVGIVSDEIIYGDEIPAVELTYSNELAKDEVKPVITWSVPTEANVGVYAYNIVPETYANWNVSISGGVLTIKPAAITDVAVTSQHIYNSAEQTATVEVEWGEKVLTEGVDYKIVSGNTGKNAGKYTVTVEGMGNFTGTLTADWTIAKANVVITIASDEMIYGEAVPAVELSYSNEQAKAERVAPAITWAVSATPNVGEYTASIQFAFYDNWTVTYVGGKLTVKPAPIDSVEVTGTYTYDTTEQTAEVVVKDGYGNTLVEGKDYTISGNKGTNAGEYTVTVEGIGNYTGTLTADWIIEKANVTITIESDEITYGEATPAVELTYSDDLAKAEVAPAIVWSAPDKADAGSYTAYIPLQAYENWNVTIVGGKLTVKPAEVVINVNGLTIDNNDAVPTLVKDTDYTVTVTEPGVVTDEELGLSFSIEVQKNAADQIIPGEYAIVPSYNESGNWNVTVNEAKLTVTISDDYICWNVDTGVYYDDVTNGLDAAIGTGATVQMLKDATDAVNDKDEIVVIVHSGLTFDLNGYYVETDNMLSYGVVLDTATGIDSVIADDGIATGGIVISNDTTKAFTQLQPENAGYFPIYDGMTGSYKFYAGTSQGVIYSTSTNGSTSEKVNFRFRLLFERNEAYLVIYRTMNAGIDTGFDVVNNMSWTGITGFGITYVMSDNIVKNHAYLQYTEGGYSMQLTAYGIQKISGGYIDCQPTLVSQTGVVFEAETLHYDVP